MKINEFTVNLLRLVVKDQGFKGLYLEIFSDDYVTIFGLRENGNTVKFSTFNTLPPLAREREN